MYYSSYNRSEEGCAEDDIQKESIFQTRCLVLGNVCSLVIDDRSCTNVTSARLVSELNLETIPHP